MQVGVRTAQVDEQVEQPPSAPAGVHEGVRVAHVEEQVEQPVSPIAVQVGVRTAHVDEQVEQPPSAPAGEHAGVWTAHVDEQVEQPPSAPAGEHAGVRVAHVDEQVEHPVSPYAVHVGVKVPHVAVHLPVSQLVPRPKTATSQVTVLTVQSVLQVPHPVSVPADHVHAFAGDLASHDESQFSQLIPAPVPAGKQVGVRVAHVDEQVEQPVSP